MKRLFALFKELFGGPQVKRITVTVPAPPPKPRLQLSLDKVTDIPDKDIDDLWEILESYQHTEPEFRPAFNEIMTRIDSLSDVVRLYDADDVMETDDAYWLPIKEKIAQCTEEFDDWRSTYEERSNVDPLSSLLLERALTLAESYENWLALWSAADNSCQEDLQLVKDSLVKQEWTEEEWGEFRDEANDDAVVAFVFEQILRFHPTPPKLIRFYRNYQENWDVDDDIAQLIRDKILSICTRQEVQIISELCELFDSDSDLKEAADELLKA